MLIETWHETAQCLEHRVAYLHDPSFQVLQACTLALDMRPAAQNPICIIVFRLDNSYCDILPTFEHENSPERGTVVTKSASLGLRQAG